jgi:hypothetical protein
MSVDFTDTLSAALWLAGRGWRVHDLDHPSLPVCVGIRTREHDPVTCTERGKHPCRKWGRDASAEVDVVAAMFTGNPRNIGLAAGASGLLIVDEDVPGAFASFAASKGQPVPDTFTVRTGRGLHYYFHQPTTPLGNTEGELKGSGCNVRGAGGYVVAPGSVHVSGVRYEPVDADRPVLPCPEWLESALRGRPTSTTGQAFDWAEIEGKHEGTIPDHHRHPTLVSYAGRLRSMGLTPDEAAVLFHRRWQDCEQPAGREATWESAKRGILDDVYARYAPDDVPADPTEDGIGARRLVLVAASSIKPARVLWLYDGRLALGSLGLLAGREGQGKSTITAWLIAAVTRGTLPGEYAGSPKAVLVCATEDSWAHTIVPRLIAAGADLDLVYRVDVVTSHGTAGTLGLPRDLPAVQAVAIEKGAAMLVLDPLTSRLSETLDTHKDADTRRALEPLVAMAEAANLSVLGLIHFNKGTTTDPLTAVMASKAFTAVARSVHTVVRDPDDDALRYFGTPKNNLGRDDLPLLSFTITGHPVETDDGTAWTSKIIWGDEVVGSVSDVMARQNDHGDRSAIAEACDWLTDWLETQGGRDESAAIKRAGGAAGHSVDTLKRARRRLGLTAESVGFPRRTYWALPPAAVGASAVGAQSEQVRGELSTALTTPTEDEPAQSVQSVQSAHPPETLPQLTLVSDADHDPWVTPEQPFDLGALAVAP